MTHSPLAGLADKRSSRTRDGRVTLVVAVGANAARPLCGVLLVVLHVFVCALSRQSHGERIGMAVMAAPSALVTIGRFVDPPPGDAFSETGARAGEAPIAFVARLCPEAIL
jgi:1,4-dihydroxy-2-naphthoate octaprenyltransferase